MELVYIRQTISGYATEGEEIRPPREGYILLKAALIGTSATWALLWGPAPQDDNDFYE